MGFCGINKNEKNNKPQQRSKNEKKINTIQMMCTQIVKINT